MTDGMLDFDSIADPILAWARDCFYCHPNPFGAYNEDVHLSRHLPKTCPVCGETSPNALLYEMNHGVNLGRSWQLHALVCTSLGLRLNHLTYDLLHRQATNVGDWAAIELGWTIAPDGAQIAPQGWPVAPTFEEVYG